MSETEQWTVGRLLKWTTDYLGQQGADNPRLDAEVLLAEALGCQRIELYTTFDELPDDATRATFRALVRRRAEGVPVAYLVGRREFYSLSFRVTSDVLIPRPETEFLVVALLDLARQMSESQPITVCDVGTGSGILAVCAAKHLKSAEVVAVDISPAALEVARGNAADHAVADRVTLVESDLLAALPDGQRFDFIISNPPYVSSAEMETLMPDVKDHEPHLALEAGPRGTEVIERLVPQAAERLKPGGHLLIEISPMIHDAVCAILEADDHFRLGPTLKDLAQLPRVVQAVRV